ncbi:MAG TPA: STAS domain-containing protein [bacterium]|nr:STAS domain-containing protein [bacterium]HQI50245.1 STAS domain-containing protein [bacterium]HQJ63860.1 STAS domain-containing protein [bacterium]
MSSFSVKTQLCSQTLILFAGGYLNRAGGEALLKAACDPAYDAIRRIVLDVGEVQAANSLGITSLLELMETLKSREGGLVLVRARPALLKTFSIMGLYRHAFKADSVREALDLLA